MEILPEIELHLRPAVSSEAAVIRRMVRSAHLNPIDLNWRHFLLAVTDTEEIAGCVQIRPHRDGTRELASLVVAAPMRGRGLARRLIEAVRMGQQPPLYLMCESSLEPMYRKFGFQPLLPKEMPPHYWRLYQMVENFQKIARKSGSLSVMRWE